MENDQDIVTAFVHDPEAQAAARRRMHGNGFVVPEAEVVANTRKGKQVMNVKTPDEAQRCVPVDGRSSSPSSARTARCWSSRSPRSRKWRAARACGCRNTRMAAFSTSRPSRIDDGPVLAGFGRPHLRRSARGTGRMDRRPRLGRPHGAEGFSAHRQVRLASRASDFGLRTRGRSESHRLRGRARVQSPGCRIGRSSDDRPCDDAHKRSRTDARIDSVRELAAWLGRNRPAADSFACASDSQNDPHRILTENDHSHKLRMNVRS